MNSPTLTLLLDIGHATLTLTALLDNAVVYERSIPFAVGELYDAAVASAAAAGVELADIGPVELKDIRMQDTVFKPSLIGLEQDGTHITLYDTYMKLQVELRDVQRVNVVISGDIGHQDAIAARLQAELDVVFPPGVAVQVSVGA